METPTRVDLLMEETWEQRKDRASRREALVEGVAGVAFAAAAATLLALAGGAESLDLGTAAVLLALYMAVARVEFPIGAGHVVPTQLVLVPMLVLLPPATVPPLVALGLVAGAGIDWSLGRIAPRRVLSALPDSWHAIGAAAVLCAAGSPTAIGPEQLPLLGLAFTACCATDLAAVLGRAALTHPGRDLGVYVRVIAMVWVVDSCLAPIGFVIGVSAEREPAALLLVLPLALLLLLLARDRNQRIDQAHRRLKLVEHERERLQAGVRRLGDAFASNRDLRVLLEILLNGSMEAVDATAGGGDFVAPDASLEIEAGSAAEAPEPAFELSVPMIIPAEAQALAGELHLVRGGRPFEEHEVEMLRELARKAAMAGADILEHRALRDQAETDALTGLGNRRKLRADIAASLESHTPGDATLLLFDLDGFKSYNDTFGHLAGDALLVRVAAKLTRAAGPSGRAYRLGGDEFCALLPPGAAAGVLDACSRAFAERGEDFAIRASCGAVDLPGEAGSPDAAIELADRRMYASKRDRATPPPDYARDVLIRTMQFKQPHLDEHGHEVADLALLVGRRLGVSGEELDEIVRAAELHDVGKLGIPDAILNKPGPLDSSEWDFMRQHTILGERILHAAPGLRSIARLVRASHERWDGRGYPDGVGFGDIPLGARVVAVCDAYEAMTSNRPYRDALDHSTACDELRAMAGSQFDPVVVDAFLDLVEDPAERLCLAAVGDR